MSTVLTVLSVLGVRPQFIKASLVSEALRAEGRVREHVVHTGQHFDANLSAGFFDELGMAPPTHTLGIQGGVQGEMTGRVLIARKQLMPAEPPDAVMADGDPNSTLPCALAAAKVHIPGAHVEAGLRSFNMGMPGEVNRVFTARLSQWLFTPTYSAAQHPAREGVEPKRIFPVGDVMCDVPLHHGARSAGRSEVVSRLGLAPGGYVLATIPRAENTDDALRFDATVTALCALARQVPVVWPVHPRTRLLLSGRALPTGLQLIDPVGYLDMVQLERAAALIATDSRGVQKEAFWHGVPCVTLHDETEWVELVDAGWNRRAPPTRAEAVLAPLEAALGTKGAEVQPDGACDAALRVALRLAEALAEDGGS
jgi:UDP-GlcNAc3NAcA epimerase